MTPPYRTYVSQARYYCPSDEAALLVRLSQRRAGISTISGKPRAIYRAKATPFADHLVLSVYEQHLKDRVT